MNTKEDIENFILQLELENLPSEKQVFELINQINHQLINEENLLILKGPLIVVGDIHGQFFDLLKIFNELKTPKDKKYLFLGDIVDRGYHSIETLLIIICYKLLYPSNVFIIRGNHENIHMNNSYGFSFECKEKYSEFILSKFNFLFELLPLAAIIDKKYFCVHGGLTEKLSVQTIKNTFRFKGFTKINDILWSDPGDIDWFENSFRGAGKIFGKKAIEQFLKKENLLFLVRSHQLVMDGYKVDGRVITIWSAPNYCYTCNNKAAVMIIDKEFTFFVFEKSDNQFGRIK